MEVLQRRKLLGNIGWIVVCLVVYWIVADYYVSRRYAELELIHSAVEKMQEERIAQYKDWLDEWRAKCQDK